MRAAGLASSPRPSRFLLRRGRALAAAFGFPRRSSSPIRRAGVIGKVGHSHLARAMGAAKVLSLGLVPVTDDLAAAVIANRGERMDGAFEAVERVLFPLVDEGKGPVIGIPA